MRFVLRLVGTDDMSSSKGSSCVGRLGWFLYSVIVEWSSVCSLRTVRVFSSTGFKLTDFCVTDDEEY